MVIEARRSLIWSLYREGPEFLAMVRWDDAGHGGGWVNLDDPALTFEGARHLRAMMPT